MKRQWDGPVPCSEERLRLERLSALRPTRGQRRSVDSGAIKHSETICSSLPPEFVHLLTGVLAAGWGANQYHPVEGWPAEVKFHQMLI